MNIKYGEGHTDCFLDIKNKKVFRYRNDAEELHRNFGGKQYYCSRSGLSGAGVINDTPFLVRANTLCRIHGVKVNDKNTKRFYVQDHFYSKTEHSTLTNMFVVNESEEKMEIWKFYEHHLEAFLAGNLQFSERRWEDVRMLKTAGDFLRKEIVIHHTDSPNLGYPFHLFLRDFDKDFPALNVNWETPVHAQLTISKVGNYYTHFDRFNIPIARWDIDPILHGHPIEGWTLLEKWTSDRTSALYLGGAYYAKNKADMDGNILVVGLANDEYVGKVDYEKNFDRLAFADVEGICKEMNESMEKKRVTLFSMKRHEERRAKILSEIEAGIHDNVFLTFGEACEAGFCKPGIDRFLTEYGIEVDRGYASENDFRISVAALRHSEKYEMFKMRQEFQTLVTLKVMKSC